MLRALIPICVALIALSLAACGDDEEIDPTPTDTATPDESPSPAATTPSDGSVAYDLLLQGTHSGLTLESPEVRKVTSDEGWDELWAEHQAIVQPTASPPPVDFDTKMLIAVFDAQQPTGGYQIEVQEIVASAGTLTVSAERTVPGPGCAVTLAFTQPFHIVITNATEGEPELSITESVHECE